MELMTVLKHTELFRGLGDAQIERIMQIGQRTMYPAGTVVFGQGSEGDAMFVIAEGQVEIQIAGDGGENRLSIYLGAGQIFGEVALIDQGKRSASVVVVEDKTEIYRIPARDFVALCAEDTAIGYIIMRNLALDLSFKLRHQNLFFS